MSRTDFYRASALAFAALFGAAASAMAADTATPYRGAHINVIIGTGSGGGYAAVTQLLQRYMVAHIPGKPTLILQFMPGAGGVKAANYLYNVAPRDGNTIGMLTDSLVLAQLMQSNIRYDGSKFGAIGRMMKSVDVFAVMQRTKADTLDKARGMTLSVGASAKDSVSYMNAMLMNTLLGYMLKPVLGYPGVQQMLLAMEKGELDGYVWSWPTIKDTRQAWLKDGTMKVLAQVGLERADSLRDVPLMQELAKSADDRAILEFMAAKVSIGRSYTTPPGFPKVQLAQLRDAFMATMSDKAFLADAEKHKLELEPLDGATLQAVITKALATPPALVGRMKTLIGL